VDQVEDLIEVESAALVLGDRMPGVDPALVKAVGEHDGRVFALLDLEALLAPHLG
jgi:chemotaxis signal transduction protein